MKALVIFVFLLETHPIYIQKRSWFFLLKNVLIQSESIGFGQLYRALTWPIRFEDSWNSNNSRKVIKFFLCIWILMERSYKSKWFFSSLCQGMLKDFRHRDYFLLIIFIIIVIIIIIIIITIIFYLTSVKIHIDDKTN